MALHQTPAALAALAALEPTTTQGAYVRLSDGGKYKGDLVGVHRHGDGTCVFPNSDRYKGQWRYGQRHGMGTLHTADGFVYNGEWREDKACGQGVAVYKGIGTYTGEFANNQRCGWGVMQFEDGTRAEGEWAHDTIHGEAVCTHADGSVFVGCYEHGVRTRGTLTKGCSKWQGPFVDDMLHGHGSCVVEGQYEYTGRFAGGLRDGPQGRCVYADGSVYEGGWAGGMRVGHGVLSGVGAGGTWERYEGAWVDDSPHGDGTITYHDGSVYKGVVLHGLAHGWGVHTDIDGMVTRGMWTRGVRNRANADPTLTRWQGAGLYCAIAGQPACFQVQLRDALCNAVEAEVVVRLTGNGGGVAYAHVQHKDNGWYTATYTLERAGQWCVDVLCNGMVISPPTRACLTVVAGACDAAGTRVEVQPNTVAVAWHVVLYDAYGNVVEEEACADRVHVEATCGGVELCVAQPTACRYQCTLPTDGASLLLTIDVLVDNIRVRGCPIGVDLRPSSLRTERPVVDLASRWAAVCVDEDEGEGEGRVAEAGLDVPVIQNLADLWMLPRLLQDTTASSQASGSK